jgi:hypothetical protein
MRKKAVLVLMAGVVAVMAIVWSWSTEIEAISPSDIIVQQGGGSRDLPFSRPATRIR